MIASVSRAQLRRSLLLAGRKAVATLAAFAVSGSVIASPPKHDATAAHRSWFEIGKATFYGRGFQGKRTATGERFNMYAFTCAHRSLPLGSWLRVTNLTNRRSTLVRVNDRGPYGADKIVDLSFAAAQRLGLFGTGKVRVEAVRADDPELAEALHTQTSQQTSDGGPAPTFQP